MVSLLVLQPPMQLDNHIQIYIHIITNAMNTGLSVSYISSKYLIMWRILLATNQSE